MGYGANEAVEDSEYDAKRSDAQEIAEIAASLIAAGDSSRVAAIEQAKTYMQLQKEAANDPTHTIATLDAAQMPRPSRKAPQAQINSIASELMDLAMDAAETLRG